MSRFYDFDAADALVPELERVLGSLRDERAELIELRDEAVERRQAAVREGAWAGAEEDTGRELRRIELRMRGIVDRMQAEVVWLDERSIVLRDIATGLIDLPALVAGRQVWLCWRLGEERVEWWHELDAGFAGRQHLSELA